MLIRLSNVVYWIATGLALLSLLGVASLVIFSKPADPEFAVAFAALFAAISYGFGQAVRYVVQGK